MNAEKEMDIKLARQIKTEITPATIDYYGLHDPKNDVSKTVQKLERTRLQHNTVFNIF